MRATAYKALSSALDCVRHHEELSHGVAHNAIRDWIWTYFSYNLLNAALIATTDASFGLNGQWVAQELYSTLGMAVFGVASKLAYQCTGKTFPTASVAASFLAGAVGIYAYDKYQVLGMKQGVALGLNTTMSNYFSAIFTGFEGPTQTLVISITQLLSNDQEWTHFKQNPNFYLRHKLKELALSSTLGLIPGAVWQVIFSLGVAANLGPIATAFLVAVTVAVCNVIYAKSSKAILESECCSTLFCQSSSSSTPVSPTSRVEAPCSALWSCVSAFFSSRQNTPALPDDQAPLIPAPVIAIPIN